MTFIQAKFSLVAILLGSATCLHAQAVPSGGDANRQSGSANPAQSVVQPDETEQSGNVITVRGSLERKSSWKRAEGDHATVYSNGSEADLRRVTEMLDREYALLERMFGKRAQAAEIPRPTIVLIGGNDFQRALHLSNVRSEEGPFARPFRFQRYLDPRIDGTMIAVGRSDQYIPVAAEALEADPFQYFDEAGDEAAYDDDTFDADPGTAIGSRNLRRPLKLPHVYRPWEGLVYSAFAQEFILSRFPASYPRWYLDGVGALFSTLAIGPDGSTEYGRTPDNFASVYNSSPVSAASDVIAGATAIPSRKPGWSPYQAWVLAHYFLLGEMSEERRGGFIAYLRAVADGETPASAARHLGDLSALDADVKRYAEGSTYFFKLENSSERRSPTIVALSPTDAELLRARVELGARTDTASTLDAKLSRRRTAYLTKLAETASSNPGHADTLALLAEAECAARRADNCAEAANRLIANAPDDPRGQAWQAMASTERAIGTTADARPGAIDAALRAIIAANRADSESPIPLLAYFRLYVETGRRAPEKALLGMMKVVDAAPGSASLRLALGRELAAQGRNEQARETLLPIAFAGYATPEQAEAARIVMALRKGSDASKAQ